MVKVALYGEQGRNHELEAFAEGWGKVVWRHPHFWQGEVEGFGLVVLSGLHCHGREILSAYQARGIPVVVMDLPYFRDVPDYWQVSLGGLNHIPPFACPESRWKALGLSVRASGGDPKGYTLVTAQTPYDASHGLTEEAYNAWLGGQSGKIRPHPHKTKDRTPLYDDLAGAKMLKTLCSTSGVESLLAGVPAVADMPERAAWGELSGAKLPSVARRKAVFSRMAYAQWTLDEIRAGECAAFLRDHWLPNEPMDMPAAGNTPKRRGRPRKTKEAKA